MDPRPTRKDAEKAARALLDARAKFIGDLRIAQDDVDTNTDITERAALEVEKVLTDARAHAADVTAAAARVAEANVATYTSTYKAATDAGWTPADLTTLGFTAVTARKTRITKVTAAAPTDTPTP